MSSRISRLADDRRLSRTSADADAALGADANLNLDPDAEPDSAELLLTGLGVTGGVIQKSGRQLD